MKTYFNKRLILFIALSLILGIVCVYFLCLENYILFSIVLVIFLCFSISLSLKFMGFTTLKTKVVALLVFICAFLIGCLSFYITFNNYESENFGGYQLTLTGTTCYSKENTVILKDVQFNGAIEGQSNYKITVFIKGESNFVLGDRITFTSFIVDRSCIYENSINGNNLSNKLKYYTTVDSENVVLLGNFATIFDICNLSIRNALLLGLDYQEFSVAYAMLCGDSDYMVEETLNSYRDAGVAHIFAVSGLHIGFLALALNFILKRIPISRVTKLIITITIMLFYSGICGFSSSSIRATIMCAVMLGAKSIGKRYDPITSVSISAILILLINPVELICVGFQLSFVVVLSILILSNPLSKLLKFLPEKFASSLATVISAQVGSIPICLYAFGKFSLFAVIANLLLLPIVSVIFIGLLILTILTIITGWATVLLFIPNYVFKVLNFLITIIDYRYFIVGGFTFGGLVLAYYFVMLIASGMFNFNKIIKIVVSVSLSVICVFGTLISTLSYNSKTKVYAFGSDYSCMSIISSYNSSVLVVSKSGGFIYEGKVAKLWNKFNHNKLTAIVFQNGIDLDSAFATFNAIYSLIEVENCYLQFEHTNTEKLIFTKTFKQVNFTTLESEIKVGGATIKNCSNGYGIEINNNNKCAYIFSNGYNALLNGNDLISKPTFILCNNYLDEINGLLKPLSLISYTKNYVYKDAESHGNFLYLF